MSFWSKLRGLRTSMVSVEELYDSQYPNLNEVLEDLRNAVHFAESLANDEILQEAAKSYLYVLFDGTDEYGQCDELWYVVDERGDPIPEQPDAGKLLWLKCLWIQDERPSNYSVGTILSLPEPSSGMKEADWNEAYNLLQEG